MGRYATYLLTLLVILLLAAIGYFIFQNQKLISHLTRQQNAASTSFPIQTPSPIPTQITSPSASPSKVFSKSQVQENIEAAINSKNLAALASYMTMPKVDFSLMSSECCQPMTPDEAVIQMNYIDQGIPLDFNQGSDIIKNLKTKNPQLANSYIGVSNNKEHLAAFTINNQNRISAIQLAITWKLYNY